MADFLTIAAELRQSRFRPDDLLQTPAETLAFINQVGFCLLSPYARLNLPNLADISRGSFRRRRDQLMLNRQVYYGRPFCRRAGFVALELLPALYALSPTAKYDGDRFLLFRNRFLSADANRITGIVLAKGPLPTRAVRRESGLAGAGDRYRFVRAMAEAESRFLIAKTGIAGIEDTYYTYKWDTFPRFLPEIPYLASKLSIELAAKEIIACYVDLVGAATAHQIAATLTLNAEFVDYIIKHLEQDSPLNLVTRGDAAYLVSNELFSKLEI